MIEKFTGLSGVESYNLFTKEEYDQSGCAFVKFAGNNDEMWHMGHSVVMDYGPLFMRRGMADDVYICDKRQLNLAAPRLFINEVNVQYKQAPFIASEGELKKLTSSEESWRILAEEVRRIKWVSRAVDRSIVRVAFESFELNSRAISLSRQADESITVSGGAVYLTVLQVKKLKEAGIPIHPPVKPGEKLGEPINVDQLLEELTAKEEKNITRGGEQSE